MASSGMKLGREDYKKKKELEEFRKLGAAPAEVDDDGYSINPHIPQYMAEAPWYLSNGRPGLRHQRLNKDISKMAKVGDTISKGYKYDSNGNLIRNKKWQIGACDNCGASTHKTKECVYRPRKFKAKYVPINIAPEEHVQKDTEYTYDGKRDRWNNFNIANHQFTIERYEKLEKERRDKKAAELDKQILDKVDKQSSKKKIKKLKQKAKKVKNKSKKKDNESSDDCSSDSDSDDSDDSDLDSDDDMKDRGEVIQRFDSKKRQTVRNLRIREDLPKYLRNLSTKSAYYDPKTRSMRANPYEGTDMTDELYIGDNFIRQTGDSKTFDSLNTFVWQSRAINGQKSHNIHLQSNPTMTELAFKEFNNKKSSVEDKFKALLTAKYGGETHLLSEKTKQLIYGQSESYREFGADGRVIKGQKELITKSKYIEDIYPGNHSSVWGSYFDVKTMKWGYKCCHCLVFNAYCTGNDGIKAQLQYKNKIITNKNKNNENKESNNNESNVGNIGVMPRPKEFDDMNKLVNPSGYISTRGIMAAKGIARKVQKQQLEKEKMRKMKKRAKKKKRKLQKRQREKEMNINEEDNDGYGAEKEESNDPPQKKVRFDDST